MKITITGLSLSFDSGMVTDSEQGPLEEAKEYLAQVNDTLHGDVDAGAHINGVEALDSSQISVTEQCSECDDEVDKNDDFFSSPCGTFCDDCMHKHAKTCGVCKSEFDL